MHFFCEQIAVNAVFLMPIRLVCISAIFLFAVGLSYVVTIGYSHEELKKKPLTGWRKFCKYILRFSGRAIAFFFGFHKIKKNGTRATREEVN